MPCSPGFDVDRHHAAQQAYRGPGCRCGEREADCDAQQREQADFDRENAEDGALRGAQRLVRGDGPAPALDEARDRVRHAYAAGQHRGQPRERQEFRESPQHGLHARRRVGAVAHKKARLREFRGNVFLERSEQGCARLDAVAPAYKASGLDKAGFLQCAKREQNARSEGRASREAVWFVLKDSGYGKGSAAERKAVAKAYS